MVIAERWFQKRCLDKIPASSFATGAVRKRIATEIGSETDMPKWKKKLLGILSLEKNWNWRKKQTQIKNRNPKLDIKKPFNLEPYLNEHRRVHKRWWIKSVLAKESKKNSACKGDRYRELFKWEIMKVF